MIDTGMLAHLTVSLDGATKEVLESIRINVKFEDNLSKIRHLIEYAGKKNHFYTLIFAFCFMKRNYQDLPKFMEMIHELRGVYKNNRVVALIQPLENFELPEYRKWVHKEHHDLIGESELQRVLQESHAFAKKHDIITSFYNMTLEEFLDKKMSMPPYFVRKMDEEVFLSRMEEIGKELDDVLGKNKENLESRFRAALLRKFREHLQASIQEYSEKSLSPSKVHSPSKKLEQTHLLLLKTIREQRKPLEQFLWDDRLKNSLTKDIVNAFPIVHGALKIRIFEHADQFLHHLFAVGKELTPLYAQEMDKFLAENFEKHLFDWKEVYTVKNACLVNDLPLLYYSQKPNEMGFKISALVKSFSGYHLLKNGEIISAEQLKQNIALVFNKDGHAQKLNVYLVNAWSATEENSYVRAFLFFVVTHKIKKMIIGNRKSPLLWKLSQVYRAALATFGVQVTFIDGQ